MLLLIGISAVVASLAAVAIAVATVRAMMRVEKATERFTEVAGELHTLIGEATEFTREARETVVSVRGSIAPLGRVAKRFEALGDQTADLASTVLGEVGPPLRIAAAVAGGLRSGIATLLERWFHRFQHGRSTTH